MNEENLERPGWRGGVFGGPQGLGLIVTPLQEAGADTPELHG